MKPSKIVHTFALLLFLMLPTSAAPTNSTLFTTLNCYWYFQSGNNTASEAKLTYEEWDKKAGHLVGLLPAEAPLFVGFQEIGDLGDLNRLVHAASQRYKRKYQPLFVQGNDSATDQDVGAILDTSRGWGVYGRASRVSDLERELSKHLVVRLTNAFTHIDVAVVHLRVPRNGDGDEKQKGQNRALLRWAMRHLAKDPKANIIIMGDFNEGNPVGSREQNLAVLFQARPPMIDVFDHFKGTPATHASGMAFDRILISDGLFRGSSGLGFSGVQIQRHSRDRGETRRLYTDHYPVSVLLDASQPTQANQSALSR